MTISFPEIIPLEPSHVSRKQVVKAVQLPVVLLWLQRKWSNVCPQRAHPEATLKMDLGSSAQAAESMSKGRNLSVTRAGSQSKSFTARILYCYRAGSVCFLFFPLPYKNYFKLTSSTSPLCIRCVRRAANNTSITGPQGAILWSGHNQCIGLGVVYLGEAWVCSSWKEGQACICGNQVEQPGAVTAGCPLFSLPPFFNYRTELQLSTHTRQNIHIQNLQRVFKSKKHKERTTQ